MSAGLAPEGAFRRPRPSDFGLRREPARTPPPAAGSAAPGGDRIRVRAATTAIQMQCVYCHETGLLAARCSACAAALHAGCRDELLQRRPGCTTPGCAGRWVTPTIGPVGVGPATRPDQALPASSQVRSCAQLLLAFSGMMCVASWVGFLWTAWELLPDPYYPGRGLSQMPSGLVDALVWSHLTSLALWAALAWLPREAPPTTATAP